VAELREPGNDRAPDLLELARLKEEGNAARLSLSRTTAERSRGSPVERLIVVGVNDLLIEEAQAAVLAEPAALDVHAFELVPLLVAREKRYTRRRMSQGDCHSSVARVKQRKSTITSHINDASAIRH
jgi:hypothetical protein